MTLESLQVRLESELASLRESMNLRFAAIEQARQFNETVSVDAAILTKADVDEKGGAPLSIAYTIKKPILYLGMGQEYDCLEEFNVSKILERLGF